MSKKSAKVLGHYLIERKKEALKKRGDGENPLNGSFTMRMED